MEPVQILMTLGTIIGVPILALIGYQHSKISKLEDQMSTFISESRVDILVRESLEQAKEKIEDKFNPIAERLIRLEDKIDRLLYKGDNNDNN